MGDFFFFPGRWEIPAFVRPHLNDDSNVEGPYVHAQKETVRVRRRKRVDKETRWGKERQQNGVP